MKNKRGQITVFIIIGLIILFVIGTVLYLTRTEVTKEIEAARPRIAQIPLQVQPVHDVVTQCIERLAKDGLRRIGDSGGYIDHAYIRTNAFSPTEGDGVQMAPGTDPAIAYWWYMKSPNKCQSGCEFDSKQPGLYRTDGGINIEQQLDAYITSNLAECVGNFESLQQCRVTALETPQVTSNVARDDTFFVGKYKLRATCQEQTFDIEDYYVNIDLNLREIYQAATNITQYQAEHQMMEQLTLNVIDSFQGVDSDLLPPDRDLELGAFSMPTFWIKYEVIQKLKQVLVSYIPLVQAYGTRNYEFRSAPSGTRDSELYELIYNGQFNLPLYELHPTLEIRFNYFDWWEPYFDINCKGQLCTADNAHASIAPLFITINRYNFPYDLSYPVMIELRNPDAFNNEGYSFKFMLEHNMRNSAPFTGEAAPIRAISSGMKPSIFCNPDQRIANATITAKDLDKLTNIDGVMFSYVCGKEYCHLGQTTGGKIATNFPPCIGGYLNANKQGYGPYSVPLDITDKTPLNFTVNLYPTKKLTAKIRNYALTKQSKRSQWEYQLGVPLSPPAEQRTYVQMTKQAGPYEDPYFAIAQLEGNEAGEIELVPGNYTVMINSFYVGNITIPVDERCFKYKKFLTKKKKCYKVPEKPIHFTQDKPFPYGAAEYTWEVTPTDLRGKTQIEFRQFIIAVDKLDENERIVEDLQQIDKIRLYGTAEIDKLKPVLT